jgi:hypothetical protein
VLCCVVVGVLEAVRSVGRSKRHVAMSQTDFIRWGGLASIVGGIGLAAFVLIHPWDQFVGAAVARTGRWRLAHTLHFVGAAFALLGLSGLYLRQITQIGGLGTFGFILSFIGTAMFVGTGMITAFVWPMLAVHAPATVELHGAMFDAPALIALSLTAVMVIAGYALFGIASLKAGLLPRSGIVVMVVGAILGMLPPHPLGALPWAGLVLGGVMYGAGLIWLGWFLWTDPSLRP